jgi:hypothetical protein
VISTTCGHYRPSEVFVGIEGPSTRVDALQLDMIQQGDDDKDDNLWRNNLLMLANWKGEMKRKYTYTDVRCNEIASTERRN